MTKASGKSGNAAKLARITGGCHQPLRSLLKPHITEAEYIALRMMGGRSEPKEKKPVTLPKLAFLEKGE